MGFSGPHRTADTVWHSLPRRSVPATSFLQPIICLPNTELIRSLPCSVSIGCLLERIQTLTNTRGQASQPQLPLRPPRSLGLLHAEFPLVPWVPWAFQYLLAFAHAVYSRNALLPPLPLAPSDKSFRCFYIKEGEVLRPLFCVPTTPCPDPGKSTDWLFENLSAHVCLATSPAY